VFILFVKIPLALCSPISDHCYKKCPLP
jgi:hypothetical protein